MKVILLLIISNIFMVFAWYGHLKFLGGKPIWIAIAVSWIIALFEYVFQVPANRIGYATFTLAQLKIIQEIITMVVFTVFAVFVMKVPLNQNFLWASLCLLGAVSIITLMEPIHNHLNGAS